jgi:hypothetical protein
METSAVTGLIPAPSISTAYHRSFKLNLKDTLAAAKPGSIFSYALLAFKTQQETQPGIYVRDAAQGLVIDMSSSPLVINARPKCGKVLVKPTAGEAVRTSFSVTTFNFEDEDAAKDLEFAFFTCPSDAKLDNGDSLVPAKVEWRDIAHANYWVALGCNLFRGWAKYKFLSSATCLVHGCNLTAPVQLSAGAYVTILLLRDKLGLLSEPCVAEGPAVRKISGGLSPATVNAAFGRRRRSKPATKVEVEKLLFHGYGYDYDSEDAVLDTLGTVEAVLESGNTSCIFGPAVSATIMQEFQAAAAALDTTDDSAVTKFGATCSAVAGCLKEEMRVATVMGEVIDEIVTIDQAPAQSMLRCIRQVGQIWLDKVGAAKEGLESPVSQEVSPTQSLATSLVEKVVSSLEDGGSLVLNSVDDTGTGMELRVDSQVIAGGSNGNMVFSGISIPTSALVRRRMLEGSEDRELSNCQALKVSQTNFHKTNQYYQAPAPPGVELGNDSSVKAIDAFMCGSRVSLAGSDVLVGLALRQRGVTDSHECVDYVPAHTPHRGEMGIVCHRETGCLQVICLWFDPGMATYGVKAKSLWSDVGMATQLAGPAALVAATTQRTCSTKNGAGLYSLGYKALTCPCDVRYVAENCDCTHWELPVVPSLSWACYGALKHGDSCHGHCAAQPSLVLTATCLEGDFVLPNMNMTALTCIVVIPPNVSHGVQKFGLLEDDGRNIIMIALVAGLTMCCCGCGVWELFVLQRWKKKQLEQLNHDIQMNEEEIEKECSDDDHQVPVDDLQEVFIDKSIVPVKAGDLCTQCGAVSAGTKFCGECGAKREVASASVDEQRVVVPSEDIESPLRDMASGAEPADVEVGFSSNFFDMPFEIEEADSRLSGHIGLARGSTDAVISSRLMRLNEFEDLAKEPTEEEGLAGFGSLSGERAAESLGETGGYVFRYNRWNNTIPTARNRWDEEV